jgi:peptidoglycan/xylan/chitin deacetylase (PgdA/CDA1 family)
VSSFVISLDFELFWGVADSRPVAKYRTNIEGEWTAVPRMLALFRRYGIAATWATVGMVMCRDHAQWRQIRPSVLPGYFGRKICAYSLEEVARDHPRLFFARSLVQHVLETPGQEVASHTFSHFLCAEEDATLDQFAADLVCARAIASEMGVEYRSLVFPRNQIRKPFVGILPNVGINVYRGNPDHWLYREGHSSPGGVFGRAVRFADTWLPLSGAQVSHVETVNAISNVPASIFLRPWSRKLASLEPLRLHRVKTAMTAAALYGGTCHLWWHPHNFGVNLEENIATLETLLKHYLLLHDRYGMRSLTMADSAKMLDRPLPHTQKH